MKVGFKKIEKEDLELIMGWRNQDRIRMNSRDHRLLNMDDQLKWFEKISSLGKDDMYIVLNDGAPVGVCGLAKINRQERSAEITYYLGRQRNSAVDVSIGIEAYAFLKKKGFEEYRLDHLYGEAFEFNEGGIKLAYFCGFKKEGIKKQSVFYNEKYWDGMIVGMTADEYRREKGVSVAIIVQARMGSTRLSGKVLKKVMGKSLLEYLLERLKRVKKADQICVATTTEPREQPILEICSRLSVRTFRGSEEDVLERYFLAAQQLQAEAVVRITADCPLIDPIEIDKLIEFYLRNLNSYNYVSHSLKRSYPVGMEAEIFSFEVLKKAYEQASSKPEREHVTPYIYSHPEIFRLGYSSYEGDHKDYRLTVDTPEDFRLISKIIESLYPINPNFSIQDILELLRKNPRWPKINSHIKQKALGE